MGRTIPTSATLLLVFSVLLVSGASFRVLLDDENVSHSPVLNPDNASKSDISAPQSAKKVDRPPATKDSTSTPSPTSNLPPLDKPKDKATPNSTDGKGSSTKSEEPADKSKEDKGGVERPSKPENGTDTSKQESKEGSESPPKPEGPAGSEVCDGWANRCYDGEKLVACLRRSVSGSKELELLLQNTGDRILNVKIKGIQAISPQTIQLSGSRSMKERIPNNALNGTEIVLNAGRSDCILHLVQQSSGWNLFQQLPTPTPIHGVYLLAFTVVIAGGTWACWKFGKRERRHDSGVSYQQLEMGTQPQSGSAVEDSQTADGWDEGWDDNWEDEEAVAKPAEKLASQSVSSNGLTSKAPNKDGWDDDWDD